MSELLSIRSEINMTPLVDVVLVLLIIFMVITTLMQEGYDVVIPGTRTHPSDPEDQIVVSVLQSGSIFLNRELVTLRSLPERLANVLRGRSSPTVFFAADDQVIYGDAVAVMDAVRKAHARLAIALSPAQLGVR